MEFTPEIIERLKHYVYIYSDPDTQAPFYIGKGYGNRCFQHLNDESESKKVRKLNELRENGKKPTIELLRYGLNDNEATLLEAAIIDFVGIADLTNKVRGIHSRSFGRISVDEIIAIYTAEDVDVQDNVLLIKINKLYHSKMSEQELYEATRGIWKVGDRRKYAEYVFSVFHGIVREVYSIEKWHPAGTLEYQFRELSNCDGRWEFEGKVASENIRDKYVGKSIRRYIARGNQNPIRYINCP